MNELSAAVLREQLKKIDALVRRIKENNSKVREGISGMEGISFRRLNDPVGDTGISLVFFVESAVKARLFKDALQAENIRTMSGGYPCVVYDPRVVDGHVFLHWGHILEDIPRLKREHLRSVDLMSRAVHLDISPLLGERDIDDIVTAVRKVAAAVL
jgi:dTDP-4-amino-4,6-dideoxygalactose transaminase